MKVIKRLFFNRVQSQCRTLSVIECQKRSAFIFPGAAEACLSVLYMAVMGTELTLDCQVILFYNTTLPQAITYL